MPAPAPPGPSAVIDHAPSHDSAAPMAIHVTVELPIQFGKGHGSVEELDPVHRKRRLVEKRRVERAASDALRRSPLTSADVGVVGTKASLYLWAVIVGSQRASCRGHVALGEVGNLCHARRRLATTPFTGRAHRPRPRTVAAPNTGSTRTGTGRSRDPHHGHAALLGGDQPHVGQRVGGMRHEHRTHQLCTRRCRGMALHGTACSASG